MATKNAKTIKIHNFNVSRRNLRCGSCQGMEKKFAGWPRTCSQDGVLPTSKTCDYYTPEYGQLTVPEGTINPTVNLINALRLMPANLLQHMAYLMISTERIQRFLDGKYHILQKVYFKYRGTGDYLSNYCWAYILDADKDNIVLLGKSGEMIVRIDWACARSSLQTEEEFELLREDMVSNRAIYDPELEEEAKRLIRSSMRSSASAKAPEGQMDMESAAGTGELAKELVQTANLADLFANLSETGNIAKTADSQAWKAALERRRENSGGDTSKFDGEDSFSFRYGDQPADDNEIDVPEPEPTTTLHDEEPEQT